MAKKIRKKIITKYRYLPKEMIREMNRIEARNKKLGLPVSDKEILNNIGLRSRNLKKINWRKFL